jgi:hypothetical protein
MSAKEAKLYGIVDQVAAQAPWGGQMPSGSGAEGELVTA